MCMSEYEHGGVSNMEFMCIDFVFNFYFIEEELFETFIFIGLIKLIFKTMFKTHYGERKE